MTDHNYQPTLSQLRAFVAVAEYRHFGTAAARLDVSQPTLSQALAALESGLGVQLIERSTRRVLVTPTGRRLLPQAVAAIEAADRFLAIAAGMGDRLSGSLRMGIIPTVAPYLLPAVLPAVRERLPELSVHVVEDRTARLIESLQTGVLDVAVMAIPSQVHGMVDVGLYREDFVIVVPLGHPLADRDNVDVSTLDDQPLLLLDEGHCLRDQTLELCRTARVRPGPVGDTRAVSLTTIVGCVAGGLGLTLIPEMAIAAETARRVAVARFTPPAPGRAVGLVFRASSARSDDYEDLAEIVRAVRPR